LQSLQAFLVSQQIIDDAFKTIESERTSGLKYILAESIRITHDTLQLKLRNPSHLH